ncbi:GntR family transcriptional regulator [Acuticoccus kandeliae]|uniref:GntR family transcriptional regulator n=1 Tax=Acuticoccus kandeliae TaxID=2073160 RepID=UPI000D3E1A94|nr:GntR family transcriptional regulator [Acuticoccus kandeliae]
MSERRIADSTAVRAIPAGGAGGSAAARVYDDLRDRIVNMEILPDTILSRAELAREYGVSQTPIREAMQRLEQDGLVRTFPQSRTVVTRIDAAELFEAHFLRTAVEIEVARQLATGAGEATLAVIEARMKMHEALVGDVDQILMFYELDRAFHEQLFIAIGHPGLHAMLTGRTGHHARARRLELPTPEHMRRVAEEHRAVVEALHARDGDAAAAAMRAHLGQTIARIEALRIRHPDAFSAI